MPSKPEKQASANKIDQITFWQDNSARFPSLISLAVTMAAIPASSAASDCLSLQLVVDIVLVERITLIRNSWLQNHFFLVTRGFCEMLFLVNCIALVWILTSGQPFPLFV
jgi:hypothetical protein